MREVIKLAFKYVVRQKRKSLAAIIAISIVTTVTVIAMNFDADNTRMLSMSRLSEHGFFLLSTDFLTEHQACQIMSLIEADETLEHSSHSIIYYLGSAIMQDGQNVVVYAADESILDFERVRLIQGRFPSALNEAVIEENLVQLWGVELGDSFELDLKLENGEMINHRFVLTGILRNMPNRARYHGEFGIIYTVRETMVTFGDEAYPSKILLRLHENYHWFFTGHYHMHLFESTFSEATGAIWQGNAGYIGFRPEMNTTGLISFIPAVFVISIIMTFGVFSISIASRERQYTLLRYVRMSKQMVFYLSLCEAAIIGFVGWVIGVIVGYLLHGLVFRVILSTLFGFTGTVKILVVKSTDSTYFSLKLQGFSA